MMMTNLIATVVVIVSTNTSTILPQKWVPIPCPDATPGYGCLVNHAKAVPDPDAKERTIETKAIETTVLTFDWNGPREIRSEKILWSTSIVERMEWRK